MDPSQKLQSSAPRPLLVEPTRIQALKDEAVQLESWFLDDHQIWDLELLLNGGFSPLQGYLAKADYDGVLANMRLADGSLWPMPIMLDVDEAFGGQVKTGQRIALRHPEGMVLAILTVEDCWKPDKAAEARAVFGTEDTKHPGVNQLMNQTREMYVGGKLEGLELSPHHTFNEIRHTPEQLREEFERRGWKRVVAFQTRNPLHRAHVEVSRRAAEQNDAKLLIHPVVGRTSPGDVDYFSRVRCYQAVIPRYPNDSTMLSLLPLAMRMGGPREALWHALIRRNYGCTHFVVGRDHAGPGVDSAGKPFYGPFDAVELVKAHEEEAGIQIASFEEMVYAKGPDRYMLRSEVPESAEILNLSGTELRKRLRTGEDVPEWFSYPEVVQRLRERYPARDRQGFTVFFTGLSGAGKSTVANILVAKLMEEGSRPVTLLDGDIVRRNLSSELGFSKEHRDLNILRIGFVASEITKNRGIAICAPIAPYTKTRQQVRDLISGYGSFVEVFVSSPLEVCEQRDRKGLYAKARAGLIKNFTGIDDPYEAPTEAEVVVDTAALSAEEAAESIVQYLRREGFLAEGGKGA